MGHENLSVALRYKTIPTPLHDGILFLFATKMSVSETIFIDASPEEVKRVFYDFANHKNWNPLFTEFKVAKSTLAVGDVLDIVLKGKIPIKPTVLEYDDNHLLWQGALFSNYLFSGKHSFEFVAAEQDGKLGTKFVNAENFSGVLLFPLKFAGFVGSTSKDFAGMNEALKKQVEQGN